MVDQATDLGSDVDDPDVSGLVTEDDTPLDSVLQEKQQRLLTAPLHGSWFGRGGTPSAPRPFVAMANVGMFYNPDEPPLVPDMLLSVDVALPADLSEKKNRSYFVWRYGKAPEVVVEVVSNREGRELTEKRAIYERIRVAHYVVYDPLGILGDLRVRCFELSGERYVDRLDARFETIGLSLVEWDGHYEDHAGRWLRWADLGGGLVPTGSERARESDERARESDERARESDERARESDERARESDERADRLAARLRALGVDPEDR